MKYPEVYVSVYKVHCRWKDKDVVFKARSLDLTHPYFVSIKDLILTKESNFIINPNEDDVIKTFSKTDHLMIPFQSVSLIEEIQDKNAGSGSLSLFKKEKESDKDVE